ncbi:hypothetical protein B0J11DRAFT_77551 [Dendryphion nanum]|uniref:NmrA-like domain-containing protein n=1 Tax=Dendryphion nanum TaxID=256645 RepID=A0A9P9IFI6_9PLEO|nr:hypothetical protein B0J11DRAFT_77551 [Dendryphion nanum]
MASSNYITKIAIVGAGGNLGTHITHSLLSTKTHTITALTRAESQTQLPTGVLTKTIDYTKPETIVSALQGQEALIITLGVQAPKDTEEKLIRAAAEAGVSWIMPNEWSPDTANEGLARDVAVFGPKGNIRTLITSFPTLSHLSLSTGFWYEWSLALPPCFGIDIPSRTATFFDNGRTPISVSTWPDIGATVAALLSLPVNVEKSEGSTSLMQLRNKLLYTCSFTLSQREMFASVLRATSTTDSEWSISYEPVRERYATGLKEMGEGSRAGFAKMMYARVFWEDGCGDFEREGGVGIVDGSLRGLEKERGEKGVDVGTRVAVERAGRGGGWSG